MSDYTKHTTHTDALDTLGSIISPDEGRDAIHLAVEPIEAGAWLACGGHVVIGADGKAYGCNDGEGVGIVDPFLQTNVLAGQWFWLVVYPRQITSLRHVWEHPSFPPSGETGAAVPKGGDTAESERWLRETLSITTDDEWVSLAGVIDGGVREIDQGETEYFRTYGVDSPYGTSMSEFLDHVEVYIGRKLAHRPQYFSCSC